MATHSTILAWKSHGQRSLVSYSLMGHKRVGHNLTTRTTNLNYFILCAIHPSRHNKPGQRFMTLNKKLLLSITVLWIDKVKLTSSFLSIFIYVFYLSALDLSCGMWDQRSSLWYAGSLIEVFDPEQGFESKPCALGAWSLSYWATKEVHKQVLLMIFIQFPSDSGFRHAASQLDLNVQEEKLAWLAIDADCWLRPELGLANEVSANDISIWLESLNIWCLSSKRVSPNQYSQRPG